MPLENKDIVKMIHRTLDPLMKGEGFARSGRTYYKQAGDLIFVLSTVAVGAYFSSVTGWPSHAFSVWDGVWVEGISPAIIGKYPKKQDKRGVYIPEPHTCFHITSPPDNALQYGIDRAHPHPYEEWGQKIGVENPAERQRNDLWIVSEEEAQQAALFRELEQQVREKFLDRYNHYTDITALEGLILDAPRLFNHRRGVDDDTPLPKDSNAGGQQYYLHYATLFHQRYGTEEQYLFYLHRLEEWLKLHPHSYQKTLPSCYYCGCGNPFRL